MEILRISSEDGALFSLPEGGIGFARRGFIQGGKRKTNTSGKGIIGLVEPTREEAKSAQAASLQGIVEKKYFKRREGRSIRGGWDLRRGIKRETLAEHRRPGGRKNELKSGRTRFLG